MAKHIKFTVGGFFSGYKTVEISINGGDVSYRILRNGLLSVDKKITTAAQVPDTWLAELDALNIFDWEKNYRAGKLDVEHWELIFKDGSKVYRGQGGSNIYPENWERFLDWIDVLVPELEFVNRKRIEKVTMNYLEETLTLDRNERTLTFSNKKSRHVYDLGEDIKKIFDTCQTFFDYIENDDDGLNQNSTMNFEVVRHNGATETLNALCNEDFLSELADLLEDIHKFAADLTAKIFNPDIKPLKTTSGKYIFCKVKFDSGYKHYTYRTEDETLAVGDVVDVPVGKNNDVAQARIVEIGYFEEYEAPFPIDRIKQIIGKHVATEWENY